MITKTVSIRDCAEVRPGFSAKGAIAHEPGGTLQVITAQHLQRLTKGEPYRYREEDKLFIAPSRSAENYLVEPGDILFMSRGVNNYAVLLAEVHQPTIAPLTFYILKTKPIVLPAYLTWCINQEGVKCQLKEIRTAGIGTPLIPRTELSEIKIPLPSMQLQQKIANLADLQARERFLTQMLSEEAERLNRLAGLQLFSQLMTKPQE